MRHAYSPTKHVLHFVHDAHYTSPYHTTLYHTILSFAFRLLPTTDFYHVSNLPNILFTVLISHAISHIVAFPQVPTMPRELIIGSSDSTSHYHHYCRVRIKKVDVDEQGLPTKQPQLGSILEERERASSAVSNSGPAGTGSSPRNSANLSSSVNNHGSGRHGLRGRLGSAGGMFGGRLGRSGSAASADLEEGGDYEEKLPEEDYHDDEHDDGEDEQEELRPGQLWGMMGGGGRGYRGGF